MARSSTVYLCRNSQTTRRAGGGRLLALRYLYLVLSLTPGACRAGNTLLPQLIPSTPSCNVLQNEPNTESDHDASAGVSYQHTESRGRA